MPPMSGNKMKMSVPVVLLITLLFAIDPLPSEAHNVKGHLLKSKTFRSPPILLAPGSVSDKYHYDMDFPQGHLAIKSFDAEVVDENGVSVPLHETYLHHWVVEPYYALKNSHSADSEKLPKAVPGGNDGVCSTLGQFFGLGSETRRTATWVPDPYGIEVGNPEKAPEGYEQKWLLNIHAIDTRGVVDKPSCAECRCDFYNVTVDEFGRTIPKNYTGGLYCCYDQTQCEVKQGFNGETRKLFLQYKVTWLDWTDAVVPVKIYIFDVTDTSLLDGTTDSCKIEYQVEECTAVNRANDCCIHIKTSRAVLPRGGDIVFGAAHQHSGGSGSSLYGQDGHLLCESLPTYGTGQEAGNEANYIVGMSTCYPKPGSIKVSDGEVLTVVSNYSSDRQHTGVMGLFYILVAEPQQPAPAPSLCFSFPAKWCLPAWISRNM
ncbi:uncharacterized protein LOC124708756 isoform X2 [Lolium rigidum]|uniref:uncharacterized protein LOC124708756 isoform X2 n=1 Tax=Lolium rigidum TaxID=89674 RepID=UPI001F5D942B|nr:uncharacterized protein LOC124708756 isoform X2 [Lolium rigidum]